MHTGNKPPVARCFLLVLALTVPGCTTTTIIKAYSGPELPPDQVAIIKPIAVRGALGGFINPAVRPHIWTLDGKNVDVRAQSRIPTMITVKPGEHILSARLLFRSTAYTRGTSLRYLSIEAEAGRTYHVKGTYNDGKVSIWIEDADSQHIVAGRKPE